MNRKERIEQLFEIIRSAGGSAAFHVVKHKMYGDNLTPAELRSFDDILNTAIRLEVVRIEHKLMPDGHTYYETITNKVLPW